MRSNIPRVFLRLDLVGCNLWLLERGMIFRVDFEEVIENDEKHGGTSEEDSQRVELGVCNHLEG